jgi:hypothetical protein
VPSRPRNGRAHGVLGGVDIAGRDDNGAVSGDPRQRPGIAAALAQALQERYRHKSKASQFRDGITPDLRPRRALRARLSARGVLAWHSRDAESLLVYLTQTAGQIVSFNLICCEGECPLVCIGRIVATAQASQDVSTGCVKQVVAVQFA